MARTTNPWKEYRIECCVHCYREIGASWDSNASVFPGKRMVFFDAESAFITDLSVAQVRTLLRNSFIRHRVVATNFLTGYDPDTTPPWLQEEVPAAP